MTTSGNRVPESAIGFPSGPDVDVREIDDVNWSVLRAFEYQAAWDRYEVPVAERTDFASVPRIFIWFIPTYGRYTKAAVLHDHLCRLAREGTFKRREADGIFRQAMRTLGVAFLRRWIMWAGVRFGAVPTNEPWSDWFRDGWLAVLISLPVLPIVVPPAVVIFLALIAWHVVELATWPFLRLGKWIQERRGKTAKRVVTPEWTLKT